MGQVTPEIRQEFEHERDDLLDDLAKLEEAMFRGETETISIQRQRISTHLRRIEEMGRLAKVVADC